MVGFIYFFTVTRKEITESFFIFAVKQEPATWFNKYMQNILDNFKIKSDDDLKRFEFTPKIKGYTSYTVSYSECDNIYDASIAVWRSINRSK